MFITWSLPISLTSGLKDAHCYIITRFFLYTLGKSHFEPIYLAELESVTYISLKAADTAALKLTLCPASRRNIPLVPVLLSKGLSSELSQDQLYKGPGRVRIRSAGYQVIAFLLLPYH